MTVSIALFAEDIPFRYEQEEELTQWIVDTIQQENYILDSLNIIFCSDDFLLDINSKYLNHDYYTDIITFNYASDSIEGELYISIDRIHDNAAVLDQSFAQELHRVIIHGILHLCGYNDQSNDEKAIMREKEDYYLKQCPIIT